MLRRFVAGHRCTGGKRLSLGALLAAFCLLVSPAVSGAATGDLGAGGATGFLDLQTATQVSPSVTVPGGAFHDTVTLLPPAGEVPPTGTVRFDVYGPDDLTCGGGVLFTSLSSLGASGLDATSDDFKPAAIGSYRVIATYSGDFEYPSVSSSCQDPAGSLQVNKASPVLSLQAPVTAAVGGNVSATVTLSGGAAPTGSLTFALYGPGDTDCSGPPVTSTKTVEHGPGDYSSAEETVTEEGTYRWVASYTGDTNNDGASSRCDDTGGRVLVTKAPAKAPTVKTGPATAIGRSRAELNGTVDPHGILTGYYFEYGETATYGKRSAIRFAGAGSGANVSAAAAGLAANTTYHYRVVARTSAGTTSGGDETFTTAAPGDPPPAMPLSAGWEYRADPANAGLSARWSSGAPIPGSTAVAVPHVFDSNPVVSQFNGSLGWYRLTFTPPAAPLGFGWGVRFAEVRRRSQVWLNGKSIGTTDDPYSPFVLPATGLIPGRTNTLVVRVDSRRLPGSPPEGWWNWGGIVRPVSLVPRGERVLRDAAVLPDVHCSAYAQCTARVIVDGDLETPLPVAGDGRPVRIGLRLRSPAGELTEGSVTVASPDAPGQSRHVRFSVPVSGQPDLWGPGHAALYQAEVTTEVGGSAVQVDRPVIGLRSTTVEHGRLLLNGRRINARGVSIHEDALGHGAALTDADLDRIVYELRAVHANMVRAHYGLDERLLSRLDRAGILVWNEGPIWRADAWLDSAGNRAAALATLGRTVLAARNHPSVVVNCIGNEIDHEAYRAAGELAYLADAPALSRRLDPTRPVGVVVSSDDALLRRPEYNGIDVLGINPYFGWYKGRTADLGPYLQRLRRAQPRPALIITEFGVEAFYHAHRRLRGSYEFQQRWLENTMAQIDHDHGISGALHWTLREFRVYPGFTGGVSPALRLREHQAYAGPVNSLLTKGVLSYAGWRKPAWFALRRAFARMPFYADGGR